MKQFKKLKKNSDGFGHIEIAIIVVAVLVVGGAGYLVFSHHETNSPKSALASSSKSTEVSSKSGSPNNLKQATTLISATAKTTPSATTPASSKAATPSQSTTTPAATSSASSSTSSTPTTPSATPLSTLTGIISSLDSGGSANVTTSNVSIPGPIGTAVGRPIVFTLGGQTYFAYTQESAPNFNASASQTASTMAIATTTDSGVSQTQAHLDKSGNLVDENETAVGYSTGGN